MLNPTDMPPPFERRLNDFVMVAAIFVVIGLLPVGIWAYATRPAAVDPSPGITSQSGPASAHVGNGVVGGKAVR